jgi:hypothetical protein
VCGDGLAVHGVFSDALLIATHLRGGLGADTGVSTFLDAPG